MPPITRAGFRIYIAALLLYPVVGYFEFTEIPPLPPDAAPILVSAVLFFFIPFFAAMAFIVYQAYRGRNWARLVLTALTVFGVAAYLPYLSDPFSGNPVLAVADILLTLAHVVAIALLFTKASNAWYRAQATQGEQAATS